MRKNSKATKVHYSRKFLSLSQSGLSSIKCVSKEAIIIRTFWLSFQKYFKHIQGKSYFHLSSE